MFLKDEFTFYQCFCRANSRVLLALFSLILMTGLTTSCRKSNSSASSAGSKEIEVSGTVKEDDPTEFTQADESVQIGGVNLTSDTSYALSAYTVDGRGKKVLFYSGTFQTPDFRFKSLVPRKYLIIEVISKGKRFAVPLPPPEDDKTTANVVLNGPTTIAAKIFEVAASKAASGDQAARSALQNGSVAVSDALIVASAVHRTVTQQMKESTPVSPINLTLLATSLLNKSIAKFDALVSEGKSQADVARQISQKNYEVVFGEYAASTPPAILAHRTNLDLGVSAAASIEVAYEAIKAVSTTDYSTVNAAFQVEAENYRTVATVQAAISAESVIVTAYTSSYRQCTTINPQNCVSPTYVPPPPPTILNSTSGGGSSGGSGGSSGGSSVPANLAQGVTFTDSNTTGGLISGLVSITKAASESDITHYGLYWGTSGCVKINSSALIISISKTGSNLSHSFSGASIPGTATHLLIFTKNGNGEMSSCVGVAINDADSSAGTKKVSLAFTAYAEYSADPWAVLQRYQVSNSTGSWVSKKIDERTGFTSPLREVPYFQTSSSGRLMFYSTGNDTLGGHVFANESVDSGSAFGAASVIALGGTGQQSNRLIDAIAFSDGTPLAIWQYLDPGSGSQELYYRQGLSANNASYRTLSGSETIESGVFALSSSGTVAHLAMTRKDTTANTYQIVLTSKTQSSSSWAAESSFSPSDGCSQRKVRNFKMQSDQKAMLYECYSSSTWKIMYNYTVGGNWQVGQQVSSSPLANFGMFLDSSIKAHIVSVGGNTYTYLTNANNAAFDSFNIDSGNNYTSASVVVDANGNIYTAATIVNNSTKHLLVKQFIGSPNGASFTWFSSTAADIDFSSSSIFDGKVGRNIVFEP